MSTQLTVRRCVHDDEPGVYRSRELAPVPLNSVGVPSQTVLCLIEIDIMVCPIKRPKGRNTSSATPNNGHFLPVDPVSR